MHEKRLKSCMGFKKCIIYGRNTTGQGCLLCDEYSWINEVEGFCVTHIHRCIVAITSPASGLYASYTIKQWPDLHARLDTVDALSVWNLEHRTIRARTHQQASTTWIAIHRDDAKRVSRKQTAFKMYESKVLIGPFVLSKNTRNEKVSKKFHISKSI